MLFGATLMVLLDALIVKGMVMGLTAWLLVRLAQAMRRAGEQDDGAWLTLTVEDAQELRWLLASLTLFAVSELACVAAIWAFATTSVFDGIHSVSSAAALGSFAVWAVRFMDRRFIHYGLPACLLNRVCRGCTFHAPERCRFLPTLMMMAVLVGMAASVLWFVPTTALPADPRVWELPFPAWNLWFDRVVVPGLRSLSADFDPTQIHYVFPASILFLELRVIPGMALLLAAGSLGLLKAGREAWGAGILAFASGMLAYAYLEAILYAATRDPIYGSLMHEAAELGFLLLTWEGLRRIFAVNATWSGKHHAPID